MDFEEKTLLSGILKYGKEGYAECCDIVSEDYFNDTIHRCVFCSFDILFNEGKAFTLPSVMSECSAMGLVDKHEEIREILSQDCEAISLIRDFGYKIRTKKIMEESKHRLRKCIDDIDKLDAKSEVADIFAVTEDSIFSFIKEFDNENDGPTKLGSYARELIQSFKDNPTDSIGVPLPWPHINDSIGGGLRTGVTLIGARAKTGKTSIGIMGGLYNAEINDLSVLYLDTEMTKANVTPRIVGNLAEVDIKNIETGKFGLDHVDDNLVSEALNRLDTFPFHYQYVGGQPFSNILSTIRRWIYTDVGLKADGTANQCLIIYDYFKLMSANDLSNNINETQAMGFQISKLTDFCNRYDVPCLSFVQLNRTGIDKETTDTIFGSDKLLHLCNSFSIFKIKTIDEMKLDGPHKGNRKFITLASRYGGEHDFGEYVSMQAALDMCRLYEIDLIKKNYFASEDNEEDDVEL